MKTLLVDNCGIVLFDPTILGSFITENNIPNGNLLDYFCLNQNIGQKAVENGALIPVYPIDQNDYLIVLSMNEECKLPNMTEVVRNAKFVLKVKSGLIISDIWAILNWQQEQANEWISIPESKRLTTNIFEPLPAGNYSVQIIGYHISNPTSRFDLKPCYQFVFRKIDSTFIDLENVSVDDVNMNIDDWYNDQTYN